MLGLVVDLLGELLRARPEGLDKCIASALARLGRFCGMDHAPVLRSIVQAGQTRVAQAHAWQGAGVDAGCLSQGALPDAVMAGWLEQLQAGTPVSIADVGALPDHRSEKAPLQRLGVQALFLLPVRTGAQVTAALAFEARTKRHRLCAEALSPLQSVADGIGAALTRIDEAAQTAATRAELAEAHDHLKTTLGSLQELVLEVDAEGRVLDVHTADPGQMMTPRDKLIGRTPEEANPPDIAALTRRAMAEVDAHGRSGPHPFWVNTPRGRRRYALTVSPRASHRPDRPPGYVFVSRDITEEWRLTREAERLGLIARRMTDLVMVIGLDSRIEWVNPAFEARTGWHLEEVRGRTPAEVLHTAYTDTAVLARIDAAMDAGQPVRAELINRTRTGQTFWTDIDMQPLHDSAGTLTGFVSIETDITERKSQAAALEQLAQEATEARNRLEMALTALPDAFAFYDAQDRLVMCNRRHRELYPNSADLMVPGTPFSTIFRAAVERGDILVPEGDVESLLASRLAAYGTPGQALERQLPSGIWQRVIDFATADGGRVAMAIDITELKQAERRLSDIIQGARAGTWEWHIPSGEIQINDHWAEMLGYRKQDLVPLKVMDWLPMIHSGDFPNSDAGVRAILAGKAEHFESVVRMRHKDGHWVWVQSRGRVARWAADGSPEVMAGIHLDISALKRAEERLEEIIDAASAGTWELDLTTEEKRVNARWAEMLGYSIAELADRPHYGFFELAHPDDLETLLAQHRDHLARGTDHFANEIRMRHKDGHWVSVLSRGRVTLRDDAGHPLKIAGIHLDVTERMRLATQLTAERDYLSRLMETSASGITALDGNGRIIFANREAERILGADAATICKRNHDDPRWSITALDGSPIPPRDMPFFRTMAEGRTQRDLRLAIMRPDGQRRILSINAAPVQAPGLAVRVVCSTSDITEQVAAEAALRSAAERAEAANEAKSRFLANMSHEIRTPLYGVLGMAQILEDELTEPRHQEVLATIRASGEMLLGVLNDVLDMSKIEAGKLTLERIRFIPAELARRIAAMHQPRAAEKGLDFAIHAGPWAEAPRLGDEGRLAQILHNLVGNALKFTESGSVRVMLQPGPGDRVRLSVRDTGIGMSAEQLSRVFEDFEQADGTVTRRFGGTGLGMSIVRRLVTMMDGEIAIDSAEGKGTAVQVTLPMPLAPEAPAPATADAEVMLQGLQVLAADDNRTNRTILGAMLTSLGADVVLVDDGRAAVSAWAAGRFDIYLLDISMPELDGISALAALRAREAAAGLIAAPALAITANAMSHQVTEYLQAGFSGHLAKPFRRTDLAQALEGALAATRAPAGATQ